MSRRDMRVAAAGLLRLHHGRHRVLVSGPLPVAVPIPMAPRPWWRRAITWFQARYALEGWTE